MAHRYFVRTFKLKCDNPSNFDVCPPYSVTLRPGKYQFDCFGGSSSTTGSSLIGYGAHVSGIILLFKPKIFYIYVGGQGQRYYFNQANKISPGGYNGGGNGGYGAYYSDGKAYKQSGCSGGGATDIRTIGGRWNDSSSLASRVIVAGAAGGWHVSSLKGGDGGGLEGQEAYDFSKRIIKGGSKSSGSYLGAGQSGASKNTYMSCGAEGNSGAGGGYYGGLASATTGLNSNSAGSGGSSFISGYQSLPVINNIVFSSPKMINGSIAKHIGDGLATITYLSIFSQRYKTYLKCRWIFIYIIVSVHC